MAYDISLYDIGSVDYRSKLLDGAYLYRVTSTQYASKDTVLNGRGPIGSRQPGRYNRPQQQTTYCATNVLNAIAEALYHQYRRFVAAVRDRKPAADIRQCLISEKSLVILRVKQITDLIHLDSDNFVYDFNDHRCCGSMLILPDDTYDPFFELTDHLRVSQMKGVVFPSARHSQGHGIALFDDETSNIRPDDYTVLQLKLRLVSESQIAGQPIAQIDAFKDKVNSTMGYYEFIDANMIQIAVASALLFPNAIPECGLIEFVRRRYSSYPVDAVF